ncbi:Mak10 subunit, NatC N-terminal acetyltransferase-domain-containing protein [Dunaliella salina]|uniref:Mak10 subunit, NatC N-terminal acetyltransferase-domain-containing protein n=1 Tax=Dunaliella salina TaxID=3046 RepID=A0ABQ7GUY5_DUNSA|nr:Mak10 subunit, NatC N-terminal acetyltransferase-domain-containing protein [Dunaliella salina]|eukprot:KAF5838431.1 Mak10 subunit, NatC N-terminal acetyltransferase-domain-containing protein [Dunaliella salina]
MEDRIGVSKVVGGSHMQGGGASYVPITGLLERVRQDLPLGEMVHTDTFSLFEAMSAVELGNVKMDAAMSGSCKSVEELIQEGAAPVEGLTPAQTLLIMERLLVMEASWHNGAALAQTVFASLYMLRPDRLRDNSPLLHAYCEGVKATCIAVRWLVMHGAVAEEEDINCWVQGLPIPDMPVPLPDARCLPLLDQATQSAKGLAKGATAPEADVYKAIAAHLEFRRDLHGALLGLGLKSEGGVVGAVAHLTSAQARLQQVMGASPGLQQQQRSIADSQNGKDASGAASTQKEGQGCEAKQQQRQQQRQESAFDAPGFVENVNKYLLGPAPPRAAVVMSTEAAYAYLKSMLGHLQQATDVMHVRGYRALVQHIERFARLRAGVVARSAAHYLIAGKAWGPAMASATALRQATEAEGAAASGTPNNSSQPTPDNSKHRDQAASGDKDGSSANPAQDVPPPPWVLDRPIMSEACALPEAPGAAGPEADLFLDQIVIASSNWAQSMLLNSCRQRRRLRRGLDDWANIYQHALNADMSEEFVAFTKRAQWAWTPPKDEVEAMNEFYPGPLSTWVECQTAASEALHLLLGFELDLYQPSEYAMVYWYCSVLLGVQRITSQVMHSYRCPAGGASKASMALPAKPGKKGNKGRAATPPSPLPDASTARRQAGLIMDAVRTELLSSMCLGLVRLQLALKVAGIVPDPILTFNSQRERFDQRFAAFHTPPLVRPEPMGYGE